MRITEPAIREQALIDQLLVIWEDAVRQTHDFLSAAEIEAIRAYVPQALREVPHLAVLENEAGAPAAFMGAADRKLEMLFVAPAQRGKGLGKRLVVYGVERYGVETVGVNEQNPQARGFYAHLGFRVYARSELDEQGNPYPILYMRRSGGADGGRSAEEADRRACE